MELDTKKQVEQLDNCNSEPPSMRSEQDWNSNNLYAKRPDLSTDKVLWSVSRLCTAFEVWRRKDLSNNEKLKRISSAKISRNMERKLGSTISQQLSSFVSDEEAQKYSVTWEDVERLYHFCGPYLSLPQANIAGFLDLVAGQFKGTSKDDTNQVVDTDNIEPSPGNRVEASLYGSRKGEMGTQNTVISKSPDVFINLETKLSPQHKRARTRNLVENNDVDLYNFFQRIPETTRSRSESIDEPNKLRANFASENLQVSGTSSSGFYPSKYAKDDSNRKRLSAAWEVVSSTIHSYRLKGQPTIETRPNKTALQCDTNYNTFDTGSTARNVLEQVLSMDTGIVRWCLMEFFDSYVDSTYLNFSEFSDVLEKEMGIDTNILLSNREWHFLRKAMCDIFSSGTKPRRLSKKFLLEERQRLCSYRNLVRQYLINSQQVEFYPWAPCPSKSLTVGSKVIARNWMRGEVYSAYVVTLNPLKEQITVKFDEAQLASSSIKDTDVMIPESTARLSNEDETTSSKDNQPNTEYLLKKLQNLQAAEEELNLFDTTNLQGNEVIFEILKRKSHIASLNLECDELFLQTFPHLRDCHDLKYLSQISKILLRGIVGDDEFFQGNVESVMISLINVLMSAFQVVNFSTLENSDGTSQSLLMSSLQNLEKLMTDKNRQSFAILMESVKQLFSTF
ncbi:MYB domain transcription factor family [Galdieria sulphuraria]|uniref:MYB domain transcription factor family n=1 Tax=Galdieria sulphuraria TaxID=130081 RepID=M2XIA4_GALSU|nr:MYB domain transcription factor family [Galdieria sulphuraria]EME29817.1 MYB domain transcription factor family [Galdieria sulphuraria]|eukprot:XP_005706337.1 MYB domain transcription factor family [Galdieria sulphuraria]